MKIVLFRLCFDAQKRLIVIEAIIVSHRPVHLSRYDAIASGIETVAIEAVKCSACYKQNMELHNFLTKNVQRLEFLLGMGGGIGVGRVLSLRITTI